MFNSLGSIKYAAITAVSSVWLLSACHALPEIDTEQTHSEQVQSFDSTVQETTINQNKPNNQNKPKRSLHTLKFDKGLPSPEAIQSCKAKDGELKRLGMMQRYGCVITYADAGKQCQDDSDCEGACYSDKHIQSGLDNQFGQCAKNSNIFGCRQKIVKGVAQPTLCVD